MKIKNLLFAAVALFAFGACSEAPESPFNPGGGNENGGGTTTGENLLKNSSFETWADGKPEGWGLTVTNGTYTQSNEANTGESAVLLSGNASANKRLASKSYTLTPGKYTLAAYMKQSGETIGQARIGYAKLTNGVVADTQNDYIYLTSASAVSSSWKQTKSDFTLTEQTEIAIIIMNSKYGEGASILVDDVTLTTVDGGIVEGTEGNEPESGELPEGTYIKESFATSLGSFTTQQTVGDYPWVNDYSTAKATSYVNSADNAATSWLVSPAVNFTEETEAHVTFDYIIRYAESGKVAENHQLLISADYSGDVATATWTDMPYNAVEGSDWSTFYKANVNIPAEFLGKNNVTFALRYTATTKAGTWEVKNFVVAHGKAEATETPDTPETPSETGEYTVAQALAAFVAGEAKPAIVKGYIVGSIDDKSISDANFSSAAVLKTNLLLADNADETDIAKCLAIQLPTGAVRDALNLVDNPGNYKMLVTLTGSLEKYFGVAGLKSVTKYTFDGETPETPDTPENPGEEPETPGEEPENPGEEPETPAAEAGVFDFTNPEGLTPSVKRATVEAGSTQGAGVEASEYTFTNGNVTVNVAQGSASTPVRFWTRTGGDVELRTYKSSTITVSVSEGTMSSIVFEGAKVSTMTASAGSFSNGTWSGNAQSVTFSVTGTLNIQKLTVK